MTWEIALVLGILLVALILFITEILRMDLVALLVLAVLALTGLVDADDALMAVDDATTDAPMGMDFPFAGGKFSRDHRHPRGHGSHLGRILRDLQITEDQLDAIRSLMRDYHEDVRSLLEGLREANQDILDAANAERAAIVARLRNGEIGFAEARDQLRALSRETREAIYSNPANEPFRAQLCEARANLLADIRDVLDPDQQAMWDAWIAGHDTDCAA